MLTMRGPPLLLFLGCAALACGAPRDLPTTPAAIRDPAAGGGVRWLVGSEIEAGRAVLANTALPLVGFGPLAGVAADGAAFPAADPDGCYRIAPDPTRGVADAEAVVRAWQAGSGSADRAAGWISEILGGATEITARDDRVVICPGRATPDLAQRLRLPEAWVRFPAPDGGPGPFRESKQGELVSRPRQSGNGPFLERIELVTAGETNAALWIRLGEVDLAVVYGEAAAALREEPVSGWTLKRAPELDRVYFLALDRGKRWTMDPSFRRWLATTIDRDGLLRYALAGEGEPAHALSRIDEPPQLPEPSHRPVGPGSRPRLNLGFDESDPLAAVIAARVQSTVDLAGVRIELVRRGEAAGRPDASLHLHLPPIADPILGLWHTVASAEVGGAVVERLLEQASRFSSESSRRDAAWLAEDALLLDAEVVPLVRLYAWLAVREGLHDVQVAPGGWIALRSAWWEP